MRIIICLDERNGYMFNNRRQSKDAGLRKRLLSMLGGKKLWMSEYSKKQFERNAEVIVDDNYEKTADAFDYCFVEDKGYSLDKCDEIWIFRWNRKYPFDKSFDVNLSDEGFKMEYSEKFSGTSHDEITLEIYKKA